MNRIKLNLSGHENSALEELGFTFPGVIQVNLTEDNYQETFMKVTTFLKENGVKSDSVVTVALAGFSPLATMQLVALHGLTGNFPRIINLIRQEDGQFLPSEESDLSSLRNDVARNMRDDIVNL